MLQYDCAIFHEYLPWHDYCTIFPREMRKSKFFKVLIAVVILANAGMASLFLFHDVFNFTSSNSAVYVLKGASGGVEISRDLLAEDANRLIFMLDVNCLFNYLMKGFAQATNEPVLELTWDAEGGIGDIKQFRPDGKVLEVAFSRFREGSSPHGLFIGGDLPYGDTSRDSKGNTSGMAYWDGIRWSHIWCAANEAFNLAGTQEMVAPPQWDFIGSSVVKDTYDEVILQSDHEKVVGDVKVLMQRAVSFKSNEDYIGLKVTISNPNSVPISYSYVYGDEPWLGGFGSSVGDVGWIEGSLIEKETMIDTEVHKYAGFWDYGNHMAGERNDEFTGYANFIEWTLPLPSFAFFSNDFRCCSDQPLESLDKRVIAVVWRDQSLMPGESRSYLMAVGMANVVNGFPRKPATNLAHLQ